MRISSLNGPGRLEVALRLLEKRLCLVLILTLAACGTATENVVPTTGTLLPNTMLKISPSYSVALDKVIGWAGLVGVAYLVLDPLSPNWHIEEAPLGDHYVHFSLKMKRYYAGGAGEAHEVFTRRAKELARLNGYSGYQVVEYTESLDSSIIGSRRTAEGVIRLTGKMPAMEAADTHSGSVERTAGSQGQTAKAGK